MSDDFVCDCFVIWLFLVHCCDILVAYVFGDCLSFVLFCFWHFVGPIRPYGVEVLELPPSTK